MATARRKAYKPGLTEAQVMEDRGAVGAAMGEIEEEMLRRVIA